MMSQVVGNLFKDTDITIVDLDIGGAGVLADQLLDALLAMRDLRFFIG